MSRLSNTLSVMSAPKDLLEGEKLSGEDVVKVISTCRRYYDYIVIDTNSGISETFLNAIDMSDYVFFLIACGDSIAIKSNNSFFRAISRMNLSDSLINIVLSYRNHGTKVEAFQRLFKYRIVGELPEIQNLNVDTGEMPFQKSPTGEFCNAVRLIIKSVLQEESLAITTETSFLTRWFYPADHKPVASPLCGMETDSTVCLDIDDEFCSTLLKDIHGQISAGRLDDALRNCLHLVGLQPHSAKVLQVLGEIFFLKRDFAHSLEVMNNVLKLNPDGYLALGYSAVIKSDDEMKTKSLKILAENLNKYPNYPDLLNDMGKLLYAFNQTQDSVEYFEKALAINPRYAEARINLAVALGDLHKYDDALRNLVQIKPKSIRAYYLIGNYLYNTGKFFGANTAYHHVSEIDAHYLDVQEKLGVLGDYFTKIQNLLELHKKLSRLSPTYPDLHYKIGNLYLLMGNRDAAREEFQWAHELKSDFMGVKRKLEILSEESEFDPKKLFEDEIQAGPNMKFSPDSWIIEIDNLEALFQKDAEHVFVLRMTNHRTGKKSMIPLFPSLDSSSKQVFEAGSHSEIINGDILHCEIFDHTGVVYSLTKQINEETEKSSRIRLPIKLEGNDSIKVAEATQSGEKSFEKNAPAAG
ncbi:MAG: tetratricopeptide repeat protein [Candidatus Riflebacteria bacterium]|nr:tetratricopeptide repeat protein [Candidatus Riflebacteria bacterium]